MNAMWYKGILCLGLIIVLSGCSSLGVYNTATGRRELIAVSTAQEVSMGQKAHEALLKENKLAPNDERVRHVERIGQSLAQVSDRQDYAYHFYVIESEQLNAFTTPGGHVYIYMGLLSKLKTDDQIAAVLAHEIGHCAARHVIKKYQAALGYNLIGSFILNQLNMEGSARAITNLSANVLMKIVSSSYSRKDEYEADRLGVKYMDLAGYDLNGIVQTLTVLEQESGKDKVPLIIKSHPHLKDRIASVKKLIETMAQNQDVIE